MFRAPPVTRATSSLNAAMLSGFVTSSMKVSIPSSSGLNTAFFDRAVANTRKPRAANSKARALPALPFKQLLWGKEALAKHVYAKRYRRTMICLPCYEDSRPRRIVQLKAHFTIRQVKMEGGVCVEYETRYQYLNHALIETFVVPPRTFSRHLLYSYQWRDLSPL